MDRSQFLRIFKERTGQSLVYVTNWAGDVHVQYGPIRDEKELWFPAITKAAYSRAHLEYAIKHTGKVGSVEVKGD